MAALTPPLCWVGGVLLELPYGPKKKAFLDKSLINTDILTALIIRCVCVVGILLIEGVYSIIFLYRYHVHTYNV